MNSQTTLSSDTTRKKRNIPRNFRNTTIYVAQHSHVALHFFHISAAKLHHVCRKTKKSPLPCAKGISEKGKFLFLDNLFSINNVKSCGKVLFVNVHSYSVDCENALLIPGTELFFTLSISTGVLSLPMTTDSAKGFPSAPII